MDEQPTAGFDRSAVGAINRTLHQDRLPAVGGRGVINHARTGTPSGNPVWELGKPAWGAGIPGEVPGQQLEQLSDEEFWRYARKLAGQAQEIESISANSMRTPQVLPLRVYFQSAEMKGSLPLQVPALEQSAGQAQDPPLLVCKLSRGYCLVPLTTLFEVVRPPQGITCPPDRDGETCPYTLLPAVPQWMVGLTVWHGETIAVIDLDAYLTGHTAAWQGQNLPPQGMLLIADYAGLPLGLLVSSIGQSIPDEADQSTGGPINQAPTWYLPSRAAFIKGIQDGALLLDMPLLLADVMQEIETAASDG